MRYLSRRSEFLSYIKEDSGPLANDIDWGDSLLGRLINASIRKANIAANAKRIDSVIKLLNDQFEELRINSGVIDNNVEVKKRVNKLKISEILRALNKSITSDDSEVNQIINQTDGSIKEIDSFLVKNGGDIESSADYDVDGLLVNLNNFLNDLRKGGTASTVSSTGTASVPDISAKTYNLYLKNLNYLFNLSTIRDAKAEKLGVPVRDSEYVKESFDEAGLLKKIQSLTSKMNDPSTPEPEKQVCKQKIEILNKNLQKLRSKSGADNKKNNNPVEKSDVKQISGTDNKDIKQIGTGDVFDFEKLKGVLRPLINYLSQKDKEYVNSFISLFGSTSKNPAIFERHKQRVAKIYASVKRQMSVNENMDIILSDSDNFAKKIVLVYKQLKGKVLTHPSIENYINDIKGFVSTMNSILSIDKIEPKNEIFKYISFIKEAVGDSTHILFQKHLPDEYLQKWLNIDDEKKKLETEIDNLSKNSKNKKNIVIYGIDPIIEIVRLFNRAYKLHTWPYIPSGRSRGKVSQMTLREYDYIGTGTPPSSGAEPGYGPWRNNKIFAKWEDAVMSIIANPDYQVIFDKDTVIQTIGDNGGKPDARINVRESLMILEARKEGGGKTLLKFINELMDGDKLYRTGAQAKFIKEYFEVDVKDDTLGFKGDKKSVNSMADKSKNNPVLEFKAVKKIDYSPRSIHSITTAGASASKTYYMFFQSKDNNNLYFKYSESFYHLKKCLNGHYDINAGELTGLNFSNIEPVFYASVPKNSIIQKDNDFKVNALSISDYNNNTSVSAAKMDLGKIQKLYTIFESGTSSIFGITSSIVTSSGDPKDGRAYNEYKSKVR